MIYKCKNLSRRTYLQYKTQQNGTAIDTYDQELGKMLKKLVKDRRTVASSITVNEERVDQIKAKQENTKCDFQIEQPTKRRYRRKIPGYIH